MKHLKDKKWHHATIRITRLVEQYKDDISTENRTVGYAIRIDKGYGKIGFRDKGNLEEFWKEIIYETGLYPIEELKDKHK